MSIPRRGLLAVGLAAPVLAAPLVLRPATARAGSTGAWPRERPIQLIVAFPPGGGTDVMARAMIPHMERHLPGARFLVMNRPGAGAEVGYTATATAPPDGYTMGVLITPSLQTITIERRPRYTLDDFAHLGGIVEDPGGFFVKPDSPLRTLADLAALVRQRQDVSVGTAGIGSDDHLLMLGFERLAGGRMIHVPFAGQAPTISALLGGHITVASMNIGESMGLVQDGQVRGIGQAAEARVAMAPAIPTFREAGFDLLGGVVRGLAVPAATPRPIQDALAEMLDRVMRDPAWQAEAARLYQPLRRMPREEYTRHVHAQAAALQALWQERPWKE